MELRALSRALVTWAMFFVTCKRRRLLHGYCPKAKSSLLRANPWHRALGRVQPGGAQQPCTPGEGRAQPTPLQTHTQGVAGAGEQAQAPRSSPSAAVSSLTLQKLLQTPDQQGPGSTRSFKGSLLGTGEPEVVQGRFCRAQTTLKAPRWRTETLTPFIVTAVCTLEATASTREAMRSQLSPSFFLRMAFSA